MRKILIAVCILALLVGTVLLTYPRLKTAAVAKQEQQAVETFSQYVGKAKSQINEQEETELPFLELWEACRAYNATLPSVQSTTITADSLLQSAIPLEDLKWKLDCFGYLSIPKIELEVPIYLGANAVNLNKGAGHLGMTSLPIGGESTHAVLAGHRSWNGALMFCRLGELQTGDLVYVTNPWETLTYRVIEVKIISPDCMEEILIQEDRDLLSVFTCTNPNTNRLLVVCEREKEN